MDDSLLCYTIKCIYLLTSQRMKYLQQLFLYLFIHLSSCMIIIFLLYFNSIFILKSAFLSLAVYFNLQFSDNLIIYQQSHKINTILQNTKQYRIDNNYKIKFYNHPMIIQTPQRPNYSKSGKLCDQNLYFKSQLQLETPPGYQSPSAKPKNKQNQNYFFKSVSRQKRGNFRFSIKATKGEFNYYPDHNYGKQKSPRWIIPKSQKYSNQKYQQYQFCPKHPTFRQKQQAKMKSTESMKQLIKQKVKFNKSSSMASTSFSLNKNYSIIDARQTSPSGFFNKSKITAPKYIQKKDLCQLEADHDHQNYIKRLYTTQKGFIDFKRQKQREPNVVRKSFQYFRKNYDHQTQFDNFTQTQYPIKPEHHIKFQLHLDRPSFYNPQKLGPNPQVVNIDFSRKKDNNLNYKLNTFRNKIKTRYDRVQPEPNTRLDSFILESRDKRMVSMQKVISRCKDLFPIVDPIIKKGGDKQIKQQLKKCVFKFQINQALKYQNPDLQIQKNL